ncbi:MAG: helix-turn-helix domain-containing protein [Planctomycetota bacterium]|jgi:excisionase family DNA binding protein
MAGMFYSLQEVAEKLGISDEEVQKLVSEGKLREFRDGSNVLFKVDEVEALTPEVSISESGETPPEPEPAADSDEISLAAEATGDAGAIDELVDEDTIVAGEGINVLGETDSEAGLADDVMAETKGTADEASLEEIEEDVNLDTFGSGSGLLDLSLQADDTSLGGILDEIYTAEGEQETSEGPALDIAAEAEGEPMIPEEEVLAGPEPVPEVPVMAPAYVQPGPDSISNALGIVLLLPLLAVIYTAIIAVASLMGVMPGALSGLQSMNGPYGVYIIWYVAGAAAVLSLLVLGAAYMMSGGGGAKAPKKAKAKKPKKPKKPKKAKAKS